MLKCDAWPTDLPAAQHPGTRAPRAPTLEPRTSITVTRQLQPCGSPRRLFRAASPARAAPLSTSFCSEPRQAQRAPVPLRCRLPLGRLGFGVVERDADEEPGTWFGRALTLPRGAWSRSRVAPSFWHQLPSLRNGNTRGQLYPPQEVSRGKGNAVWGRWKSEAC